MRAAWYLVKRYKNVLREARAAYIRHSTSLLGLAVENLPPPLLLLSLSISYLIPVMRI